MLFGCVMYEPWLTAVLCGVQSSVGLFGCLWGRGGWKKYKTRKFTNCSQTSRIKRPGSTEGDWSTACTILAREPRGQKVRKAKFGSEDNTKTTLKETRDRKVDWDERNTWAVAFLDTLCDYQVN